MRLDLKQITAIYGSNKINEAAKLVPFVDALTLDEGNKGSEDVITGRMNLPEFGRYAQVIYIYDYGRNKLDIESACSCSYQNCVHSAAVLLAHLNSSNKNINNSGIRPELVGWLEHFKQTHSAGKNKEKVRSSQALAYRLSKSHYSATHFIQLFKASLNKDQTLRSVGEHWSNVEKALVKQPQFVTDEDLEILRLLWIGRGDTRHYNPFGSFELKGRNGGYVLDRMSQTGRLFLSEELRTGYSSKTLILKKGIQREGIISWQSGENGRQKPTLSSTPEAGQFVLVDPVWYIDAEKGEIGGLELPVSSEQAAEFLSMPLISDAEAELVASVLSEIAPEFPIPNVSRELASTVIDVAPVPVLRLDNLPIFSRNYYSYSYAMERLDFASYVYEYDGYTVSPGSSTSLIKTDDGRMVQIKRRPDEEKKRAAELKKVGLVNIPQTDRRGPVSFPPKVLGMADEEWPSFVKMGLKRLRDNGWRVEMTDAFSHNIFEVDEIDGYLSEGSDGWFDLEMGIKIGDRTVQLVPLLGELFKRDPRWLTGGLDEIENSEAIDLRTDQGEKIRMKASRLKPVVRILVDLFESIAGEKLRISRLDAGRIDALSDTGRWQFHGDSSIRDLAKRLKECAGVSNVPPPIGLTAELRPYQQEGLNWLQFLRDQGLGGVLADDMGLGKTLQTISHVLVEKEAGRLDKPALIVVPTSLVHNWTEEASKFAPSLNVLVLQGNGRKERFDLIGDNDVVITTYPLLWRDHEALAKHEFHLLILDEAQNAKNSGTATAGAIRKIKSRHRLCLSGTPLENHLGELWSLYDFLLPGFLGSQKEFSKKWRTPIEKGGDTARRDLLARRIRPFMLRRRKDEVAKELPSKTTVTRFVELEGAQRDLYETVRSAMQEKVRDAIAANGMERSHIVVLDALLKLRQVCCDPKLVKLKSAEAIEQSAKMEFLISMVKDLIEEGRRILVFSQFTGMLDIISSALDLANVPFVILTGDTKDRATPVKQFQSGKVPVFLISLKAGGVGLNLTTADTVIHYDPWWNPAAENQATDRAHRIGQDKPVFVYKLIVSGSIEEKILSMQEKKANLAEGILSEDSAKVVKFSNEDIEGLFEPIS